METVDVNTTVSNIYSQTVGVDTANFGVDNGRLYFIADNMLAVMVRTTAIITCFKIVCFNCCCKIVVDCIHKYIYRDTQCKKGG